MKDKLFAQLAKDIATGTGDPFEKPYLMLHYGSKGLKPLVKGLSSSNREMRFHCITCLEKLGDTRAVKPLIALFNHPGNEDLYMDILEAVRQLCCWERMDLIYRALHKGSSMERYYMAILLSDAGDEKVTKELIKALKDPDKNVVNKVKHALEIHTYILSDSATKVTIPEISRTNCLHSYKKTEDVLPPTFGNMNDWIDQLKTPSADAQLKAIRAIRKKGNRKAVQALISQLHEKNTFHKEWIVNTLGNLKDQRAMPAFIKLFPTAWLELKAEIIRSMVKIGGRAVIDPLVEAMKDNHPKIRFLAAWALGIQRNSRSKNELRKAQVYEKNNYVLNKIKLSHQNI